MGPGRRVKEEDSGGGGALTKTKGDWSREAGMSGGLDEETEGVE
jgi:hypothetical protein